MELSHTLKYLDWHWKQIEWAGESDSRVKVENSSFGVIKRGTIRKWNLPTSEREGERSDAYAGWIVEERKDDAEATGGNRWVEQQYCHKSSHWGTPIFLFLIRYCCLYNASDAIQLSRRDSQRKF